MPELPEVENIAEGLRHEVLGLTVQKMTVKQPLIVRGTYRESWRKAVRRVQGQQITAVTRRAKRLIIVTDGPLSLVVQLGMTGTVRVMARTEPIVKHTHMLINLSDGRDLRLIDARRFGRLWFIEAMDADDPDAALLAGGMSPVGPEPEDISLAQFRRMLASQRAIKTLLLDQTRIAGLGNIYADEALFAAGIHPLQRSANIAADEAAALRRAVRRVIRSAIKHGGTTFNDYRNAHGLIGEFLTKLQVYQRTGQPCRRCKTAIERVVVGGRSSHYCPQCQVL